MKFLKYDISNKLNFVGGALAALSGTAFGWALIPGHAGFLSLLCTGICLATMSKQIMSLLDSYKKHRKKIKESTEKLDEELLVKMQTVFDVLFDKAVEINSSNIATQNPAAQPTMELENKESENNVPNQQSQSEISDTAFLFLFDSFAEPLRKEMELPNKIIDVDFFKDVRTITEYYNYYVKQNPSQKSKAKAECISVLSQRMSDRVQEEMFERVIQRSTNCFDRFAVKTLFA